MYYEPIKIVYKSVYRNMHSKIKNILANISCTVLPVEDTLFIYHPTCRETCINCIVAPFAVMIVFFSLTAIL